jgi:hypothetical protein
MKWKEEGDNTFTRLFGPIKATICRKWGMTPEPTEYYAFLSIGDHQFILPIKDTKVGCFDDDCNKIAVKMLEKAIKKHIRGWLK